MDWIVWGRFICVWVVGEGIMFGEMFDIEDLGESFGDRIGTGLIADAVLGGSGRGRLDTGGGGRLVWGGNDVDFWGCEFGALWDAVLIGRDSIVGEGFNVDNGSIAMGCWEVLVDMLFRLSLDIRCSFINPKTSSALSVSFKIFWLEFVFSFCNCTNNLASADPRRKDSASKGSKETTGGRDFSGGGGDPDPAV